MRSAQTFSKLLTFLEVKVILIRWMVLSSAAGLVSLYIDMIFQVMRSSDRDMERSEFSPTAESEVLISQVSKRKRPH